MEPLKTERLSGTWFMDISERGSFVLVRKRNVQRFLPIDPSIFILSLLVIKIKPRHDDSKSITQRSMFQKELHAGEKICREIVKKLNGCEIKSNC